MKRLGMALSCLLLAACSEPATQSGAGFTGVGYSAPVQPVAFAPTASPTPSQATSSGTSPATTPSRAGVTRQAASLANVKPAIVARLQSAPPAPVYRVNARVSAADLRTLTEPAQAAIRAGLPKRNIWVGIYEGGSFRAGLLGGTSPG